MKDKADATLEAQRQERMKAAGQKTEPLTEHERLMLVKGIGERTVLSLEEAGSLAERAASRGRESAGDQVRSSHREGPKPARGQGVPRGREEDARRGFRAGAQAAGSDS